MSNNDYMPKADADFQNWQSTFMSELDGRRALLGLTQPEYEALSTARDAWQASYANHLEAQANASMLSQEKQQKRDDYVNTLRTQVRRIQTHPALTDPIRAALGITLREAGRAAAPAPTTRPVAQIDTGQRLRHTVNFTDELTPTRRGKPDGVRGCEIWVKVGDPAPSDPSQLTFLALDTATPYVTEYAGDDAGKTAHYMLRWVSTRGEHGPWSQTVSATIPA